MTTLQQVIDQNLYLPFGEIATSPLGTDETLCREIQTRLKGLNYYPYDIDGIFGGVTREALRDFKEENGLTGGDVLGPTTAEILLKRYENYILPPPFDPGEDNLVKAVLKEGRKHGLTLQTQIAFIMAMVQHETANTYRPIKELGGANRRYVPYYGRGYVQLTWKANYQKYSNILGIDLVNDPDQALDRRVALFILVHGLANGTFTGRRLGQYINVNRTDFYNAVKMIAGSYRTHYIASLATQWMTRLKNFSFAPEFVEEAAPQAANLEFIDEDSPMSPEERLMLATVTRS